MYENTKLRTWTDEPGVQREETTKVRTLNLVALGGEDESTKLRKYENCVRHRREESTNVESTKVRKLPIGAYESRKLGKGNYESRKVGNYESTKLPQP